MKLRSIKLKKKRMRPISGYLDQTSLLVNKGFIIWPSGKFSLRYTAHRPRKYKQQVGYSVDIQLKA